MMIAIHPEEQVPFSRLELAYKLFASMRRERDAVEQTRQAEVAHYRRDVERLRKQIADEHDYQVRLAHSRFYEFLPAVPGQDDPCFPPIPARYVRVLEDSISAAVDLADCDNMQREDGSDRQFFWLDDDGQLHPVTFPHTSSPLAGLAYGGAAALDEFYAENPGSIYSWSTPMIANGKIVGQVQHTDH